MLKQVSEPSRVKQHSDRYLLDYKLINFDYSLMQAANTSTFQDIDYFGLSFYFVKLVGETFFIHAIPLEFLPDQRATSILFYSILYMTSLQYKYCACSKF